MGEAALKSSAFPSSSASIFPFPFRSPRIVRLNTASSTARRPPANVAPPGCTAPPANVAPPDCTAPPANVAPPGCTMQTPNTSIVQTYQSNLVPVAILDSPFTVSFRPVTSAFPDFESGPYYTPPPARSSIVIFMIFCTRRSGPTQIRRLRCAGFHFGTKREGRVPARPPTPRTREGLAPARPSQIPRQPAFPSIWIPTHRIPPTAIGFLRPRGCAALPCRRLLRARDFTSERSEVKSPRPLFPRESGISA